MKYELVYEIPAEISLVQKGAHCFASHKQLIFQPFYNSGAVVQIVDHLYLNGNLYIVLISNFMTP